MTSPLLGFKELTENVKFEVTATIFRPTNSESVFFIQFGWNLGWGLLLTYQTNRPTPTNSVNFQQTVYRLLIVGFRHPPVTRPDVWKRVRIAPSPNLRLWSNSTTIFWPIPFASSASACSKRSSGFVATWWERTRLTPWNWCRSRPSIVSQKLTGIRVKGKNLY